MPGRDTSTGDAIVLIAFAVAPAAIAALLYLFSRRSRLQDRRHRASTLVAGNALVLAFLMSTLLLAGELYYRCVYDQSDAYAMARTSVAWLDRHWSVNQLGYRDSEDLHPLGRPMDRRRVNFMGDSFTAGHGIANVEHRFVNLLRTRHRAARPWQVDMFADNGWDTGDERDVLASIQRQGYEFDVFVLVYNLNDVADLLPLREQIVRRSAVAAPFLFEHSFLLNMLWVRWTIAHDPVLANYYGSLVEGYVGDLWQRQQQRLRSIKALVERNGGRLIVVVFPFLTDLGPRYPYRDIHAKLDAFWREVGVSALDLLPVMEAHRAESLIVSGRDPHPNERAHAIAADAIDAFLTDEMTDEHR